MVEVYTMLNEQDLLFEQHSAVVDQRKCSMLSWRQNCKQCNSSFSCSHSPKSIVLFIKFVPVRHFKQPMLWRNEFCKRVVFIANMQHPFQPIKGVVIYKLVVAFELAHVFFQEDISLWRLESCCLKKNGHLKSVLCFKVRHYCFFFIIYHGNIPSNKCGFLHRLNTYPKVANLFINRHNIVSEYACIL